MLEILGYLSYSILNIKTYYLIRPLLDSRKVVLTSEFCRAWKGQQYVVTYFKYLGQVKGQSTNNTGESIISECSQQTHNVASTSLQRRDVAATL